MYGCGPAGVSCKTMLLSFLSAKRYSLRTGEAALPSLPSLKSLKTIMSAPPPQVAKTATAQVEANPELGLHWANLGRNRLELIDSALDLSS